MLKCVTCYRGQYGVVLTGTAAGHIVWRDLVDNDRGSVHDLNDNAVGGYWGAKYTPLLVRLLNPGEVVTITIK